MSAWRRSGLTVRLLAVLCLAAGCAATSPLQRWPGRDCSDLPAGSSSGVYRLLPAPGEPFVNAHCDMDTDGGNWTVIQRRDNTTEPRNFFRKWTAYRNGFGKLRGAFWLGLKYLSGLTSLEDRQYELRVELEDFAGNKSYAVYQGFRIYSEADGYALRISSYMGNANDSLHTSDNVQFSTKNRGPEVNCSLSNEGAWWYPPHCGTLSNLNGPYHDDGYYGFKGIYWVTWQAFRSLKKTEMKIRPGPRPLTRTC